MKDMHARMPFKYKARKLYEFPAVTKVDGLPPAASGSVAGSAAQRASERFTHASKRLCKRAADPWIAPSEQ